METVKVICNHGKIYGQCEWCDESNESLRDFDKIKYCEFCGSVLSPVRKSNKSGFNKYTGIPRFYFNKVCPNYKSFSGHTNLWEEREDD